MASRTFKQRCYPQPDDSNSGCTPVYQRRRACTHYDNFWEGPSTFRPADPLLPALTALRHVTGCHVIGCYVQAVGASERVFQLLDRVPKMPPSGNQRPAGSAEGGKVELQDVWWSSHFVQCFRVTLFEDNSSCLFVYVFVHGFRVTFFEGTPCAFPFASLIKASESLCSRAVLVPFCLCLYSPFQSHSLRALLVPFRLRL